MDKKLYQLCEIQIVEYETVDVVRTSAQENGITKDYFNDENWYEQGGTNP